MAAAASCGSTVLNRDIFLLCRNISWQSIFLHNFCPELLRLPYSPIWCEIMACEYSSGDPTLKMTYNLWFDPWLSNAKQRAFYKAHVHLQPFLITASLMALYEHCGAYLHSWQYLESPHSQRKCKPSSSVQRILQENGSPLILCVIVDFLLPWADSQWWNSSCISLGGDWYAGSDIITGWELRWIFKNRICEP